MGREKEGYRGVVAQLNEMFPDKGMLNKSEVARFIGVDRTTIYNYGIAFNETTGRITKSDLARQLCV